MPTAQAPESALERIRFVERHASLIPGKQPARATGVDVRLQFGGGLVGAIFVTTALIFAPRIGATYWVALIVAGQMAASVALDHFGWLGFPESPASVARIAGIGLIVGGVVLVAQR